MYFERATELTTVIELEGLKNNPDIVYQHFMNYGDEVFYVLNRGEIYGIITPGDLYRAYCCGNKMPQINMNFSYIENEDDFEKARIVFEKYSSIHEVAVIREKIFQGVMKSGHRKSEAEWQQIRRSFQSELIQLQRERSEWIEKDILKLLELESKIYIYRYLRVEDMGLEGDEHTIYEEKKKLLPTIEGIYALTKREQKKFLGDNCNSEYIAHLVKEVSAKEIVYKNGIPEYKDMSGKITNIKDGYRVVPNVPGGASKKIFMVGPCTMFGGMVNDEQTIETYLQGILLKKGFCNYEVINCSVTGGDLSFQRLLREEISAEDIVIIMSPYFDKWKEFEAEYDEKLKCLESMSEIWGEVDEPINCIYNIVEHCNHIVNKKIAEKIFKDIEDELNLHVNKKLPRRQLQDYYISWDIVEYYKAHFKQYIKLGLKGKIGSIVMNCNPFTKGHRYLIEQACKKVDYLYVFVVEENKSVFSFKDRFTMVKHGTEDFKKVIVVPSGEYIISAKTFEQYFKKENVHTVENMDYDVHIFGEVVAKELGIQYRFIGEEPFDRVTAKYNETIKRILPQYGIEVVEVLRVRNENEEIISASKVREYINAGNKKKLKSMLPDSTILFLEGTGIL